jgi:hypothetical protein
MGLGINHDAEPRHSLARTRGGRQPSDLKGDEGHNCTYRFVTRKVLRIPALCTANRLIPAICIEIIGSRLGRAWCFVHCVVSRAGLGKDPLYVADEVLQECPLKVMETMLPQTDKEFGVAEGKYRIP